MRIERTYNDFGLGGVGSEDFDYLFCGKRCRKRKKKRRQIRFERRSLKNDERRARTERMRAETRMMTQTLGTKPRPTARMPLTGQGIVSPAMITPGGGVRKAGLGGNTLMIIVGVLLIGGFMVHQNKQGVAPLQAAQGATVAPGTT